MYLFYLNPHIASALVVCYTFVNTAGLLEFKHRVIYRNPFGYSWVRTAQQETILSHLHEKRGEKYITPVPSLFEICSWKISSMLKKGGSLPAMLSHLNGKLAGEILTLPKNPTPLMTLLSQLPPFILDKFLTSSSLSSLWRISYGSFSSYDPLPHFQYQVEPNSI